MSPDLPFETEIYFAKLEAKRNTFMEVGPDVDTIIIGSSHGEYGIDPAHIDGSFNLCTISQDLSQSAMMYGWAARRNRHLRQVVVLYSIFSYGFDCLKTSEKGRAVFLRRAFGFGWPQHLDDLLWTMDLHIPWPDFSDVPPHLYNGFTRSDDVFFFAQDANQLARRVARHVALSEQRYAGGEQFARLAAILAFARRRGDRVCVVIPPVRDDYRAALPADLPLFRKVRALCERCDAQLVDEFSNDEYAGADFGDPDHLRPAGDGARRLSERVGQGLRGRRSTWLGYRRALSRIRPPAGP
ncbi:hypothetical protein [Methylobacterium sp. D54C]|jgi:hypothetical protein